jgi:hypothetical protein
MHKIGKALLASDEYAAMDDLKTKDGFIKEIEDMIETKYLRFLRSVSTTQTYDRLALGLQRTSSDSWLIIHTDGPTWTWFQCLNGNWSGAVQHDAFKPAASALRLECTLLHPMARCHPCPRHTLS